MELGTQLWIQFFKKCGFRLWKSNPILVDFYATHTKKLVFYQLLAMVLANYLGEKL